MILEGHALSKFRIAGEETVVRKLFMQVQRYAQATGGHEWEWSTQTLKGELLDLATGTANSVVLETTQEFVSKARKALFVKNTGKLLTARITERHLSFKFEFIDPALPAVKSRKAFGLDRARAYEAVHHRHQTQA